MKKERKKQKKVFLKLMSVVATLVLLAIFVGCPASGSPDLPPEIIGVTGVSLDTTVVTILAGDTEQLDATISPANASNKVVTWSSGSESVATVDSSGLVTAVTNGSVIITVTTEDGSFTETCDVTVGTPVTGVTLNISSGTIDASDTVQLIETIAPGDASNTDVTWSSSEEIVASVSTSGLVTGLADGTSIITVTTVDSGYTATYTVTVNVPVTGVALNKTSTIVLTGNTEQLTAIISPAGASNQSVTWASSDASVTVVNGLITGASEGSATITTTTVDGGFTSVGCVVTVTSTPVAVTGVTLNKATTQIEKGLTEQLIETIAPVDATNQNVIWSSSNTAVVNVSSSGLVEAFADGTATITVTAGDGSYTDTCTVTVVTSVTDITLNKATTQIEKGLTEQLTITFTPVNPTNDSISWVSSNEAAATVSVSGLITAVADGSTTITVTSADTTNGTISDTCTVTVVTTVTGVTLNTSAVTIDAPNTTQLTATLSPANPTNSSVTWSSDNTSAATVNTSGLVSSVADGTAVITITTADGSFTDSCTVTVNVPVTGISLSPATITIDAPDTTQLTATLSPASSTNQNVTWSSDNTAVATVSSTGLVTGISDGSAVITVSTEDGNFEDTSTVTVNVPVTGVAIDEIWVGIYVGDSTDLTEIVYPVGASDQSVTWSSDDETVATVYANGLVTAEGSGWATITVTTSDGGFSAECVVETGTLATSIRIHDDDDLDIDSLTIEVNEEFRDISVEFLPSGSMEEGWTVSTSNSDVVGLISNATNIVGVGEGSCTVTVTSDNGLTDSFPVTVTADITPPAPGMVLFLSSTEIFLEFSEPVTSATAGNAGNYIISNHTASVSSVAVQDNRTVVLTLNSALSNDDTLTLTISNIEDTTGHTMGAVPMDLTFKTPPAFLDTSKITIVDSKIYGLAGTAYSNTWVDYGGGLEPTIQVYALTHGVPISEEAIVGGSYIMQDGSFPTLRDVDGNFEKVFPSGSYDIYLITWDEVSEGTYLSEVYTVTIP